MYLPAHINNIMNKYKATTRLHSGRSFNIVCRKDWLTSTHEVLLFFVKDGFMLAAYCFLITTAKGLPYRLFTTPSRTYLLTHEISSTLHLMSRQPLSLALSVLLTRPFGSVFESALKTKPIFVRATR